MKPKRQRPTLWAAARGAAMAEISVEQWEATGRAPATISVCHGLQMKMTTRKRIVNAYGVPMMTFFFKPMPNDMITK